MPTVPGKDSEAALVPVRPADTPIATDDGRLFNPRSAIKAPATERKVIYG
jgi:hypothetical protein